MDLNNQDQGLWQDQCAVSANACTNPVAFARQWSTTPLKPTLLRAPQPSPTATTTSPSPPSPPPGPGRGHLLLAGANDLWKCSLAMGCVWRNTTNATTCMSAQVAEYQHAIAWNPSNPLEIFIGNDSGLWRSMDAIGETGAGLHMHRRLPLPEPQRQPRLTG